MKNNKIIFWDLKKKPLVNIDEKAKYVIFCDQMVDLTMFRIKPIVIRFHGALIEDLDNNKIILSKDLNKKKIELINKYVKKYKVEYDECKNNDKIYEIKLSSTNYYRMLVMPSFIKNEYKGITTCYDYPYNLDKKIYQNYIISDEVSVLKAVLCVIDYLKLKSNDILDLVNVCYLLIDVIMSKGYCMTNNKLAINKNIIDLKEGESLI